MCLPIVGNRIGEDLTGFLLFILIWSHLNIHLFLALWAHFTMEIVQITWNRFQWYVSVFWCGHGFMTIIFCVCVLTTIQFSLLI